jgi:alcohol dehydrogenase (NADP+)
MGVSVIPKSSHESHIRENLKSAECALEEEDLEEIHVRGTKLETRFNNPSGQWGVGWC